MPGALLDYDVPDLPALVAPRPVWIIDPIDHMSRRLSEAQAKRHFAYARGAYSLLERAGDLEIQRTAGTDASTVRLLADLMRPW